MEVGVDAVWSHLQICPASYLVPCLNMGRRPQCGSRGPTHCTFGILLKEDFLCFSKSTDRRHISDTLASAYAAAHAAAQW